MSVFGIDFYGLSKYGTDQVVDYQVDPFIAVPWNYDSIKISWKTPTGTWDKFRLVKNRRGYPVTEHDGDILIDADATFGTTEALDTQPVPGRFMYYAIYLRTQTQDLGATPPVLEDVWTRASVTSTLANDDWGSSDWLWERLPEYYKYISNGELTTDQVGNSYLWQFIQVFGWGLDILKTQSDIAKHMNDPLRIHLSDVEELGTGLGIPFDPEIKGMTMRQRVQQGAHVDRQKGTLVGWRNLINIMTGWDVDVQIGKNLLLDDDQSNFSHPQFNDWSPYINYAAGEVVQWTNKLYRANVGGSYQDTPPGTTWTQITDENNDGLLNDISGGMSTWEGLSFSPGVNSPAISERLGIGMAFPANSDVQNRNMLFVKNQNPTTVNSGLRSVARPLIQVATLTAAIDASATTVTLTSPGETVWTSVPYFAWLDWGTPTQECVKVTAQAGSPVGTTLTITRGEQLTTPSAHAVGAGYWHKAAATEPLEQAQSILDGIPVPWVRDSQKWQADKEYATNDIVLYDSIPFIALRASKGIAPVSVAHPDWSTPSAEWAAIGYDKRIGLMLSGYTHQPPSMNPYADVENPTAAYLPANVTPFIEWYDRDGDGIYHRVYGHTPYTVGNPSARVATTGPLSATYPSVTWTAGGSDIGKLGTDVSHPGVLIIDGVTLTNGDIVLVKNEATASHNGVYHVGNPGGPSAVWSLTRLGSNYETVDKYFMGLAVAVREGTANGGSYWSLDAAPTVINTSNITFTQHNLPWYQSGLFFDSFSDGWGSALAARGFDIGTATWNTSGSWNVDGFQEGTAYPANPAVKSVAFTDSGISDAQVGVTFKTSPSSGHNQGLILRQNSAGTSYFRATRTKLEKWNGSAYVAPSSVTVGGSDGSYTVNAQDGDRLVAVLSGTGIRIWLYNGTGDDKDGTGAVKVLDATDSTNQTETRHGIIVE